jgi:hypothetical protein
MNVTTGAVRIFMYLLRRLFITGKWCSNTFTLTTRASLTPTIRVFLFHCASTFPFIILRAEDIEVLFPFSFFFFSNEATGWFEVLRYRMNGNGASRASPQP